MSQTYISFILLFFFTIVVFLPACSKNDNSALNLTAVVVEKNSNKFSKVSTIEYNIKGDGAGADRQYGTADDDVFRYFVINDQEYLNSTSDKAEIIAYDSPGEDGLWFTSDDNEFYSSFLKRTNENEKYYAKFNFDWLAGYGDQYYVRELTDTEVLSFLYLGVWPEVTNEHFGVNQSIKYDKNPYFVGSYLGYTSVDVYKTFILDKKEIRVNYNEQVYNEKLGVYNFTFSFYSEKSIDPNTRIETIRHSNSAGIDGEWFTLDDVFESGFTLIKKQREPLLKITLLRYTDSGADGNWFTEDDLFHSREVSTFDSNDNLLTHNFVYSGNDGLMDTSDDNVSKSYRQFHNIDEKEHKIVRKHVANFGSVNEKLIWSDIGVYSLEGAIAGVTDNKTTAILTPEGFNFYQNTISISSSAEGEIKKYERKHVFKTLFIDDSNIEEVFDSVIPEELTLVKEKSITTVLLDNNVSKSVIESFDEDTEIKESSTYIKIVR